MASSLSTCFVRATLLTVRLTLEPRRQRDEPIDLFVNLNTTLEDHTEVVISLSSYSKYKLTISPTGNERM